MTQDFQQEMAVYNANVIELLAYAGKYVVIRGDPIRGPFASIEHAWRTGRAIYGPEPFLVKQVRGGATFTGRAT